MSRADVYRNRPPARAAAVVAPRGEMIARANASAHISELRGLSGYARHRRLLVSYHSAYGDSSKVHVQSKDISFRMFQRRWQDVWPFLP
eukprot:825138-Pleurochrysis_carterae.AAC.1